MKLKVTVELEVDVTDDSDILDNITATLDGQYITNELGNKVGTLWVLRDNPDRTASLWVGSVKR